MGAEQGCVSGGILRVTIMSHLSRTFNDESPLGIRRILSQSTDSLNMRNRTLSVESLIDEGGDLLGWGTWGWGGMTQGAGAVPGSHRPPAQAPMSSSTS